jgi:photosystem II stability/assembly factor-like uncharacterized protein
MWVSKTTNEGSLWTRYSMTSSIGYTASIVVDPYNSNIVYAGGCENSHAALYKTTNCGTEWLPMYTGVTGDTIHDIVIHPDSTNILYAGTSNGVFKSTNAGADWSNKGCSAVHALLIDPDQPDIIYAGTQSGVYKSIDNGDTWIVMNEGLNDLQITCLGICPDNYVFASTKESSMYRWSVLGIAEQNDQPVKHSMIFVYPNPTKGKTTINYQVSTETPVHICIYDIQGRRVIRLGSRAKGAGLHTIVWNGLDERGNKVSAGVYFLEFKTKEFSSNQKLLVIK